MTAGRYTYHFLVQHVGQTIREYVEQVRKQGTKCKFRSFKKEACNDKLMLGGLYISLRKRLLQDNDPTFGKQLILHYSLRPYKLKVRCLQTP